MCLHVSILTFTAIQLLTVLVSTVVNPLKMQAYFSASLVHLDLDASFYNRSALTTIISAPQ